jgi:hypothetical protein
MFARLGARDIRKDAYVDIDLRIYRQFWAYTKEDDPPSRVKPVPIIVIIYILQQAIGDLPLPASGGRQHVHHRLLIPPSSRRVHGQNI